MEGRKRKSRKYGVCRYKREERKTPWGRQALRNEVKSENTLNDIPGTRYFFEGIGMITHLHGSMDVAKPLTLL